MLRRRSFIGSGMSIFMPIISRPQEIPAEEQIFLPIPDFVPNLNLTNPQMYRDRKRVIFAATRAGSDVGGIVWKVADYVDRDHPGTPELVFATDSAKYFANGELAIWPDGTLRYITVEVNNIDERRILGQVSYLVPGWTP